MQNRWRLRMYTAENIKKSILCDSISFMSFLVQFWTPSLSRNAGERRVQDHLSAHARAKPIVAHITSYVCFTREIQKLAPQLFQHTAREKCRRTKLRRRKNMHVKPSLENCLWNYHSDKCKSSFFQSNPAGKTNLGKNLHLRFF